MASKENRFALFDNGAMLSNNEHAQSSFDILKTVEKNNAMMHKNFQAMQKDENAQNSEENNGNEDVNDKRNDSRRHKIQDRDLKNGEEALRAVGVPKPVAKKLIEQAEKTGSLDKINKYVREFKKKKIKYIIPIAIPVLFQCIMVIIMIIIFSALISNIEKTADNIKDFFNRVWEGTSDILSAKIVGDYVFLNSLPSEQYVDKIMEKINRQAPKPTAEEIERLKHQEIEKLARILSTIAAPVYYRADTLFYDVDINSENDANKSKQRDILVLSIYDICGLSYSGLADANANSYYQNLIKTRNINGTTEYEKFANVIKDNGCLHLDSKVRENFNFVNVEITLNPVTLIYDGNKSILSSNLEDSLISKTGGYTYSDSAYEEYLRKYYLPYSYEEQIEEYIKKSINESNGQALKDQLRKEALDYYATQIKLASFIMYDKFLDELNEYFYFDSASSGDDDFVSSLGSIYGSGSCAMIKPFDPLSHQYTESKGVTTTEIHSVSDGEVIYVNKGSKNLYHNWNSSKEKCLCNNMLCGNYDGNEIKIKFIVDDVEYIATYSNLNQINVNTGDNVVKGQVIGTEGNTGCTNMQKLKFQLTSESGINYNTNELLDKCSSTASTMNICNFNNIRVNLVDCNGELIKNISIYDYTKEEVYRNYKNGLDFKEFVKAGSVSIFTKALNDSDYTVGVDTLTIKSCNYKDVIINESSSKKLDLALNEVRGEIMTYNSKFALTRFRTSCNRDEDDKNVNSVYNTLCINKALELAKKGRNYTEILNVYYPNYLLNKNYCLNYASSINKYSLNNDKPKMVSLEEDNLKKVNFDLNSRIELVGRGTRASAVEAARYLTLGFNYKIPYKNGGKYFDYGINPDWDHDGIDSCGFVSWVLYNSGADIKKSLTISQLVKSANITGNIAINSNLYKYYDKIQVGDFAYREDRLGIIIGKNDGILYVAESNSNEGLIVTTISSYGESNSKYTRIYFADNYYNGNGNISSMW